MLDLPAITDDDMFAIANLVTGATTGEVNEELAKELTDCAEKIFKRFQKINKKQNKIIRDVANDTNDLYRLNGMINVIADDWRWRLKKEFLKVVDEIYEKYLHEEKLKRKIIEFRPKEKV